MTPPYLMKMKFSAVLDPIDFHCTGKNSSSKYLLLDSEGKKESKVVQVWNNMRVSK